VTHLRQLPPELREALSATGLPCEIRAGKGHMKLFVGGRLVGTLSHTKCRRGPQRNTKNVIAQVRRTARDIRGEASGEGR
jgi:hypothetical protein